MSVETITPIAKTFNVAGCALIMLYPDTVSFLFSELIRMIYREDYVWMTSESAKLHKDLSFLDLLMTSLGGIIGSGWLLSALLAANGAGPSSVFSWLIGGVVVMLIGLVYAELTGFIPESGAVARYPHYSHGHLTGFIMGWAAWIAYASVPAVEAEAVVTYGQAYVPALRAANGNISAVGLLVAAAFLVIFFIINYMGVRSFAKINTPLTIIKFIIPALTVILFFIFGMHWGNFSSHGFAPYHSQGMMKVVATAGIVFSYLGFRQSVDLSGEAKNAQRDVPRAIVVSLIVGILLYVLLQLVFLGAVPSGILSKGWGHISYSAPFAQLAMSINLGWFAILVYGSAIISPFGTGNVYTASTTRVIYALGSNGYFPRVLAKVDPKTGIPVWSLVVAVVLGLIFLAPFPSWQALVGIVSSATVLTYITGPVSAAVFRRVAPDAKRSVTIKNMGLLAPLAFIGGSLIIYWAGWHTNEILLIAVLIGVILYLVASFLFPSQISRPTRQSIKAGVWLVVYLLFMLLMSNIGSKVFGGPNTLIHYPWDLVAVALGSLAFYYWGVRSGYKTHDVSEVLDAIEESRASSSL